jgi:hypothetical protein
VKPASVKIIIAGHKPFPVIEDEMYLPVQAGKKIQAEKMEDPWIGDDTGINISDKNMEFCELTAVYWAWKNLHNYDYMGLCHYRRYFSLGGVFPKKRETFFYVKRFSDKLGVFSPLRRFYRKYLKRSRILTGQEVLEKFSSFRNLYTPQLPELKRVIANNDIILPRKYAISRPPVSHHYSQYGPVHEKDFKKAEEIIRTKHPVDYTYFKSVADANSFHTCNMFIMKKDLFLDYSRWLFPIMFELEGVLELKKRRGYDRRAIGLLGEVLLNVWVEKRKSGLRLKEFPVAYIN